MAKFDIKMPKLGESITEGTIISWSVKVGDAVNENDVLFEVTTAKVSAEVPSPVGGKILQIFAQEGDTVAVGVVVAIIEMEGGNGGNEENEKNERSERNENNKESVSDKWYSPAVLSKAQEAGISQSELDAIRGTGFEGRISKRDIENYIVQKQKGVSAPIPSSVLPMPSPKPVSKEEVPAAPTVFSAEDSVIEMDFVRRTIADRMVLSKKTSAHVTTIVEVDVTKLVRWREEHKEEFKRREGINLTFMPAIAEATVKALGDFPRVNASVDGYKIIEKKHINLGIAVSLDNGNLIVPVIHDADKQSFIGLATSIDGLAKKARQNKLTMSDIEGGTFTITNYGSFRNIIATPIINQPEVAILGVGLIQKKPAVVETSEGGMIAIRHKMYLSLSFDHRLIDGALGGMFVQRVAEYLEDWR